MTAYEMKIVSDDVIAHEAGQPVRVQLLDDDPYSSYCCQYRGGGKYFVSLAELDEYLVNRWKITVPDDVVIKWMQKHTGAYLHSVRQAEAKRRAWDAVMHR